MQGIDFQLLSRGKGRNCYSILLERSCRKIFQIFIALRRDFFFFFYKQCIIEQTLGLLLLRCQESELLYFLLCGNLVTCLYWLLARKLGSFHLSVVYQGRQQAKWAVFVQVSNKTKQFGNKANGRMNRDSVHA